MRKLCLSLALVLVCALSGCSGGSKPISLALNFTGTQQIDNGQSLNITVTGAGSKGVMWSLASFGTLSNATTTSVTYNAPAGPLTAAVTDHLTATSLDDSTKTAVLTINDNPLPSISTTQAQLTSAPATVGTAYTFTFMPTGGSGTLTWSATGLPSWLSISAAGVLSGTPPAGSAGTFNFTVTATDSSAAGAKSATSGQLTLTVNQAPAITSASSTTFTLGAMGTFTVTTTGKPTPSLTETGALPTGVSFKDNGNGTGTLSGTPSGTAANYAITFTASNGIGTAATQSFTLTVGQPPAITSAGSTTFTVGTAGTFTVTATGFPAPTFSETGALPTGVTLNTTTGVLSGTPAAGTGGTYAITIKAHNGIGTDATQSFTLTVDQAAAVTSANSATFTVGAAGTFTVTATGFPAPTLSATGTLVGALTFNPATGVLSGTPAAGTAGTYSIMFTAHNGIGADAVQNFTLTVGQPPAITSANSTTFTVGTAGTFTVTATGFPVPTFSETGALPTGVTLNATTGVLSGTPGAGTGKTYSIAITASNGVGSNATQTFTLTVDQAPAISSASSTAFTVGAAGTFTVTTTGFPTPTLSETGTLPAGVSFGLIGPGTGMLAGTPAAGTNGTYPITFTASNGVGSPAGQSFTLTVNTAPVITSASTTTFTVGTAGTFTVTATGTPAPTFSETGALPAGVTFNTTTGVLSGTPAAGTGKTYSIMFTATNSVGSSAPQSFTLTVDQAPMITSANSVTFTVGSAGSFTVMTAGFPLPALSDGGATLPSGVTFVDNGNGTATLSGTPASGSLGTYTITFTASNGVGTPATQTFTLTVNTAPVITSGSSTTFTVGASGSFTVTATGTPTPTVSESGTLPNGVTFAGGSGTGTLSGTPAAGTGGTYAITIKATSTSGSTTQNFTLTVDQAPGITSASTTTFNVGVAGSFTVTTTGFPLDPITETGALPSGVTFVDNGNNTATLSGTPAAGTAASYPITITASNGVLPNATQAFTLTVSASSTACPLPLGGQEGLLNGTYAILANGWNDGLGMGQEAASIIANGTGTITGGVVDTNGVGVTPKVNVTITGGCYTIGTGGRGKMIFNPMGSGNTVILSFVMRADGKNGELIEFDDTTGTTGGRRSGSIRRQNSTLFVASTLSGSWAFGDRGSKGDGARAGSLGVFTLDGVSTLSAGAVDYSENSVSFTGLAATGSFTAPDATHGRGTVTLVITGVPTIGTLTLHFAYYITRGDNGAQPIVYIQSTDTPDTVGHALLNGIMVKQTGGPYSNASLSGTVVFSLTGFDTSHTITNTLVGLATSAGTGTFTGFIDQEADASPFTNQAVSGTISIQANGLGTVQVTSPAVLVPTSIVMVAPNEALLLEGDATTPGNDVQTGLLQPQTGGGSFTTSSIANTFIFGSDEPATTATSVQVGTVAITSPGNITITQDSSSTGGLQSDSVMTGTYTMTANGRGDITITSGGSGTAVIWLINANKAVVMVRGGGNIAIFNLEQ
jgi:hypothetical protein